MDNLTVATVCCEMDDYLAWTLPHNTRVLDPARYAVIHPDTDTGTRALAERHKALSMPVEGMYGDGLFRKGDMISEALKRLVADGARWTILTDCDMVFPVYFTRYLETLLPHIPEDHLVCGSRWGVRDTGDINAAMQLLARGVPNETLLHMFHDRLHDWGDTPPNVEGPFNKGPWGFFQMFRADLLVDAYPDDPYPAESSDAGGDDAFFIHRFAGRITSLPLVSGSLMHLPHGARQENWHGRRTERIGEPVDPEYVERTVKAAVYTPEKAGVHGRIEAARLKVDKAFGMTIPRPAKQLPLEQWFDVVAATAPSDVVGFLDADCVPTDPSVLDEMASWAHRHRSITGLAQASNHIPPADRVYACPACFFMHKDVWDAMGRPSFRHRRGFDYAALVCQQARALGVRYKALYPSHWEEEPEEGAWWLHNYGVYGIGTFYPLGGGSRGIYHLCQSRMGTHADLFEKRCGQIIDGTFTTEGMRRCTDDYDGRVVP